MSSVVNFAIPDRDSTKWISELGSVLVIALFIVIGASCLHVLNEFPDSGNYIDMAETLKTETVWDSGPFEFFSRLIIWLAVAILGDADSAITATHYLNIGIGYLGFCYLSLRFARDWRGVAVALALYAPLLCFVTLRATPSYLLVTYAVLVRNESNKKAWAAILIAISFHAATLLVLMPMVLSRRKSSQREGKKRASRKSNITIVLASAVIYIATFELSQRLSNLETFLLGQENGGISKLAWYATSAADFQTTSHVAYYVVCWVLALVMLRRLPETESRDLGKYIAWSFGIFTILSISPVVAYRQSIYWMMPGLIALPRKSLPEGLAMTAVFTLGTLSLAAMDLSLIW